MYREQFTHWSMGCALLGFQTLFHLQELGRVLQMHADIAPHQAKRCRQQKRQAPAPVVQVLNRHQGMHARDKHRPEQQASCRACGHDAGVETALALRGILGQERRSPCIFP